MPSFDFVQGAGSYRYAPGVNAANLTAQDIRDANARLAPRRQGFIKNGRLTATRDDPGYQPPTDSSDKPFFDYAKWSQEELSKAVTDRQILSKFTARFTSKDNLVLKLQKEDKRPRFDRFVDLPAELRNNIYNIVLQDPCARVRPATPAISRVNKQFRNESLPIFFRNTIQTIVLHDRPSQLRPQRHTPTTQEKRVMNDKTKAYFKHAARQGWLKDMRRFQWRLMRGSFDRASARVRRWDERYHVQFSKDMKHGKAWTRKDEPISKARLPKVTDKIAKIHHSKMKDLTRADFNRMMDFFGNATLVFRAEHDEA